METGVNGGVDAMMVLQFNELYYSYFGRRNTRALDRVTCELIEMNSRQVGVSPYIYLSVLFDYFRLKGKRYIAPSFFGSLGAMSVFKRNYRRGSCSLRTLQDDVVSAVVSGVRIVLSNYGRYGCGYRTRIMLCNMIPVTFFAVDLYWDVVQFYVPLGLRVLVFNERNRLIRLGYYDIARDTYNNWALRGR